MNKSEFLTLFDREQRQEIAYPGLRRNVTPDVVRHVDTAADGEGLITYSQLNAANADAVIQEQIRWVRQSSGQDDETG